MHLTFSDVLIKIRIKLKGIPGIKCGPIIPFNILSFNANNLLIHCIISNYGQCCINAWYSLVAEVGCTKMKCKV